MANRERVSFWKEQKKNLKQEEQLVIPGFHNQNPVSEKSIVQAKVSWKGRWILNPAFFSEHLSKEGL